ncbi:uncharacterized protein EKO05_0010623 [Ascochyta rabiei]|uniref:uncharacterized protein n=1 Tax=Didymella rabiei TaxID=5454 RepID=UPI001901EF14|nr:uncharacterized protein EKO05_0010623 [Ascochyta rabiei]UPX20391.1 hypothetical protein EKO05_0010623 [Ascochyta rabiei]
MFFTRSLQASATLLSLSALSEAWVLHRNPDQHAEVKTPPAPDTQPAWSWNSFFPKRQGDVTLDCPDDQFATLLSNNPDSTVETFCNDWLNIPPTTVISEVTPTVTVTTSASTTTTQTNIERILTTTTLVETATISAMPSVRRRMMAAAAAQVESIASSIVESVIASGTPTSELPASSKAANRLLAEQGLATACSCKMVQPTSTVTQLYTVPAVTSTVGVRVIRVIQQTETKTYTSTTSVRASTADTTSTSASAASSAADAASSSAVAQDSSSASVAAESSADVASSSSAVSSNAAEPSSSPVVTAAPIVSAVVSENSTSTATEGVPVVTAIPFSCDEDDITKDVDQVVGGIRLGYSVYCNTELVSADRIGRPINVESPTSCAAQCSLLNAKSGQDTCQSAVFTAYTDGRRGGTCDLLSAAESNNVETAPAPGSVTIIHTGTFANGDECAALNASSVSIDTSALIASITSAGVVISTPGLVTQSSGGGVSRTYVSANSTDASGYVHWSWFELYASSASWYAVYETSWACSATITRTIEQQATTVIEGTTITAVAVTTIIGNGYTTIISGDTTTTIRGGGGSAGPTFVPASTTDGEAGVTTFFSTATQTSTGSDGLVTPTPTVGGEGNVTVIEVFSTFFSTGTAGVIAPSVSVSLGGSVSGSEVVETVVSSTATTLTISGSNSTMLSTGADGVITPSVTPILETIVSSGAVTLTLSGSDATATSTADEGVIPPPPSASASESSPVVSSLSSTTDEEEWETPGFYGPRTSTLVVVSSDVLTVTSTGLSGVETPTVITAVSSETVVVIVSNTTLSGNASTATSTSIATFNSTGSNGIITPTVVTEVITTAAGTANFTVTLATATANSTGLEGIIPPEGTLVVTETANLTLPLPTPTAPVISLGGSDNFTASAETAFTSGTGGSGVIPPASTNSTTAASSTGPPFNPDEGDRTGSYTRTASSTSASGFITPSSNVTVPVETPSANTTLVLTVPLSTGVTVTVEIPSLNSSLPITSAPSSTAAPTFNTSSSIPSSEADRSGSFSRSIPVNTTFTLTLPLSTGSITVEIPVVNSTIPVPEITPSPPSESQSESTLVVTATTNITLSVPTGSVTLVTLIPPTTRPFDNTTAPLPTPTGNITIESLVSINYSTVPSFSTGNLSTILPPSTPTTNITIVVETPSVPSNSTTVPPSVTLPPVSLNSTVPVQTQNSTVPYNPSEGDRTGSFSRSMSISTGVSSSSNATTTPPPFPTGNSTVPVGPTAPVTSTTEACPSPTEFSFITREVIITTYTIETVPVVAATCISSDAFPTAVNGSFPTGGNATLPTDAVALPSVVESLASAIESLTATEAAPTSSDLPPVVSEVTASATSDVDSGATAAPLSRFRRTGTLATEEQIAAACADKSNLVLSPALNIQPDNSTEGWFVGPSENTITVTSVTTDNGTIAQFRSAFPGRTISLIQPLTLCPGTQYELSALTRQASSSSRCTAQFRVGNDVVFTATPQTSWISETERFTAGAGPEGASVDLQIVGSCAGFFGAPVGADADGYMVLEVGPVSVVADAAKK